jgi:hypothetical protein
MPHIVLSEEQAKVVASALQPIQVRDAKGTVLGVIPSIWTDEDIAEAKRRLASNGPWYTTEQVLAHLRSLETK